MPPKQRKSITQTSSLKSKDWEAPGGVKVRSLQDSQKAGIQFGGTDEKEIEANESKSKGAPPKRAQSSIRDMKNKKDARGEQAGFKRFFDLGRMASKMKSAVMIFNLRDPEKVAWLRAKSRRLNSDWRFTVLTTVLTVYALFGDDMRLASTHRRIDELFNAVTIIAVLVFAVEIVVQCLGQDEYFLGFFFSLDLGSTITLAFDLTWVSNELFCGTGEGEALKTSRAGRAGARASRTVRIIRLMRLVKLYKAYRVAVEKRKEEEYRQMKLYQSLQPGESMPETEADKSEFAVDQDADEDIGKDDAAQKEGEESQKSETRVGKKLSDMTTRRVIILVLVMLVFLPQFSPHSGGNILTSSVEFQDSAKFAADIIHNRWKNWCGNTNSSTSSTWCFGETSTPNDGNKDMRYSNRFELEKALLDFIYQHHHGSFFWQLYWVGVDSKTVDRDDIGLMAALNNAAWLGQDLTVPRNDVSTTWDQRFVRSGFGAGEVQSLSVEAVDRLTGPWQEACPPGTGVVVQKESRADGPTGCSISQELRCQEVEYVTAFALSDEELNTFTYIFAFDQRPLTQMEAALSILQTIFICLAVGVGAMWFSKDANELLLNPIERMIEKMETIKDNPLEAMRLGDLEFRREGLEAARVRDKLAQVRWPWKLLYKYREMNKPKEPMETVMLEKTIIKLGGLLALGFGEAGAEVIGENMKGGASAGVNAMVPGVKVDAVIGFCNIRHFSEATEVLKEKVMLFVNQVGEIVHGCVDDFHGAPNKNIGDSFLLVWRLSGNRHELGGASNGARLQKLGDMALMSYVKIIAEINKSRILAAYRNHPGLQQRIKDFRVEMGFGLHCGWAIEGTIGSEFKIDASYLSPNVNVAARLESATTQYGVWTLISHNMVNLCSGKMALNCRLIDHVTVKGSRQPVRLYTIDLNIDQIEVETKGPDRLIRNRFKIRQLREVRKSEKWAEDYEVGDVMRTNRDVNLMRMSFSDEFFQRFAMAYRNYEAGEWMAARDMLYTCFYQPKADVGRRLVTTEADWPEDGPTVALLKYMQKFDYVAPNDWAGYRELAHK
mmetsp:Transcript_26430/g.47679  ORF Transcript_26430/g.47679 Transcript_26430/m.47679 type:complete len:1059 (+) Transcript_26430:87-3263(+)